MILAGTSNDDIKYLLSKRYEKDGYVLVDDLFILGLQNCKKSDVSFVVVCPELIESDEAKDVVKYYSSHFKCYQISQKVFSRLSSKENCAGIMVLTKIRNNKDFLSKSSPLILVCDGLEISGNIGTIFRTAESVKVDGIIFTNCKARICDDKVVRASRGMIFNVPFVIENNIDKVIKDLQINNIRKVVCEPEQGIDFKEFDYNGGVAIVVGSERYGVNKIWFKENSEYIKIPMYGEMDSLNVGVATSLVLYEAIYSRKK